MNDLQQDLDALVEYWKGEVHPTHWSTIGRDRAKRTVKQYANETAPYLRDIGRVAEAALDYYGNRPYPSLNWEVKKGEENSTEYRRDTYKC